ncbi:MinD/ParA family protein [Virgibacillus oceani]|uniref:Flagellum site-determining protein YlxH n=1 Tax=Virgibacillus oceani TaxID=1479511 RepID=A0A917H6S8_9BACI|nr:MinD/ParA family protein [Virgibacillus oceani]GGG68885.1 flagellum site-determining protein YlxH [Virgibacillus oceani]
MIRDQATGLRRKLSISKSPKQAKTISIVSGKGGVGKSNFALNFSLELVNQNKKVLLFDLDVGMGNIDILMGLKADKTIVDMFNEQLYLDEIIETGPNDLAYIAAGSGLTDFFSMDQEKLEFFLEQYNDLVQMYDFIVFDMGAGASNDSFSFIMASDECIVITTPEPTSITDAYGMIKHIVNKTQKMPIYVVMNRSASRKYGLKALDNFEGVIRQFLQVDVQLLGVLPDDKTVQTAVLKQTPYLLLNDRAAISKSLKHTVSVYLSDSINLARREPFSFVQKIKQLMIER